MSSSFFRELCTKKGRTYDITCLKIFLDNYVNITSYRQDYSTVEGRHTVYRVMHTYRTDIEITASVLLPPPDHPLPARVIGSVYSRMLHSSCGKHPF